MACQRPSKGFKIGLTEAGKDKYKIVPFCTNHVEYDGKRWIGVDVDYVRDGNIAVKEWIPIPCGKCFACQRKRQRDWTCRLLLESRKYKDDEMWFLTLTYNDKYVPYVLGADSLGECKLYQTLDKRDLQLFWKRLRDKYGEGIRYFACGEYGSNPRDGCNPRPHYHAVVFGLSLHDAHIRSVRRAKSGLPIYEIEEISKLWHREDCKEEAGFVQVGKVTPRSLAYVAGYCLKKAIKTNKEDFSNRVKEFNLMSRRPGLGSDFVPDCFILTLGDQTYCLPRFYRKNDNRFDADITRLAQIASANLCKTIGCGSLSDPYGAKRYLEYMHGEEMTKIAKYKDKILRNSF